MGLILAVLSVTLRADQVIVGVTLVVLAQGPPTTVPQAFSSLTARTNGLPVLPIPVLSRIPVLGPILFNHDATVYLTAFLVFAYRSCSSAPPGVCASARWAKTRRPAKLRA